VRKRSRAENMKAWHRASLHSSAAGDAERHVSAFILVWLTKVISHMFRANKGLTSHLKVS
jgi:hypothetical protein